MDSQKIRDLEITAARVRILGLDAINSAASGHVGGAFSIADILTVLYFNTMKNLDPANPRAPERDRFVLSKGHCTAALYPQDLPPGGQLPLRPRRDEPRPRR